MALGQCRECGKEVSDSAKVCPNCGIKTPIRKSVPLIQAVIVIVVGAWIISKMGGMLGVEHTASTTTASVTPNFSSISVDSLYVNGKEIQIGDTDDQVFKLLTKDQMVSQTEEKDPNNALSLLIIKHIQVNGKKFTVYFSRAQDPGPYKVTKIIEHTASNATATPSQYVDTKKDIDFKLEYLGKEAITAIMKDPKSVEFKDLFVSRSGGSPVLCGLVNGKNSYGGYTGFKRFLSVGNAVNMIDTEIDNKEFKSSWNQFCSSRP